MEYSQNTTRFTPPRVFVSYTAENTADEEWVENFVNKIRREGGAAATFDKALLNNTSDLNDIMVRGFRDSDKVIIVCTEAYVKKAEAGVKNTGVGYEVNLATIIARGKEQNKLIFVKKDNSDFQDILPFQFKGEYVIDLSGKSSEKKYQELYKFIWDKPIVSLDSVGPSPFVTETDDSVRGLITCLGDIGMEVANLRPENITEDSCLIWPVVPRKKINSIHFAQIELIKILSKYCKNLLIIIADCCCGIQSEDVNNFKSNIEKEITGRNIELDEIELLSHYFEKGFKGAAKILQDFINISSVTPINELEGFNLKDHRYGEKASGEVKRRPVLKYIRPILVWTAVNFVVTEKAIEKPGKHIIIAGNDESTQWSHAFSKLNMDIGAVYIPKLEDENYHTVSQEADRLFYSKDELMKKLGKGNIDKWLFQTLVCLPNIPNKISNLSYCKRNRQSKCSNQQLGCYKCLFPNTEKLTFPQHIDKGGFAEDIFKKINPA